MESRSSRRIVEEVIFDEQGRADDVSAQPHSYTISGILSRPEELDVLYRAEFFRQTAWLRSRGLSQADASDVAQDVFLNLIAKPPATLGHALLRFRTRCCFVDHVRRATRSRAAIAQIRGGL